MDKDFAQLLALLHDAMGYADKVRVAANDIFEKASKLKDKADEYDNLSKSVSEKKAELSGLVSEHQSAQKAYDAFKQKYIK